MDDNDLLLDEEQAGLVFRAAGKLQRHGDDTLKRMLEEIVIEEDETETLLARAAVADLLLPGED